MDSFVRMAWTMLGLWVLAHATSACSADSAASADAATGRDVATLSPGEKVHCEAPGCCVPVDVDPNAITLYRSGSSIGLDIILHLPSVSENAWAASVEASLWGQSATCTTRTVEGYYTLAAATCRFEPFNGAPVCGSTATLTLRLGTSTYADVTGTQILCSGTQDVHVNIPVTLVCPTCPYRPATDERCNLPDEICYYSEADSKGATHQLPCWCQVNSNHGDRRWSCAVP
jgi:hypothetical protein